MEVGTREEVYKTPMHPYTQALLSAVPIESPNHRGKRSRIVLEGDVPSPANPPVGLPVPDPLLEGAADLRRRGAGADRRVAAPDSPLPAISPR